jgi:hypothetical protein
MLPCAKMSVNANVVIMSYVPSQLPIINVKDNDN